MNLSPRSKFGRRAGLGLLALCAAAGLERPGSSRAQPNPREDLSPFAEPGQLEEGVIWSWPELSKELARAMMSEYGRPDDYTERALFWFDNGPWKRTVVYRDPPKRRFWGGDGDFYLEQVVAYDVPDDKVKPLHRFNSELIIDQALRELGTRSDSQGRNYLTLNLADEVVTGKRDPDEAWEFLDRITRLTQAGKSSPYVAGLRFETKAGGLSHP